jgi:hypothetical protein
MFLTLFVHAPLVYLFSCNGYNYTDSSLVGDLGCW